MIGSTRESVTIVLGELQAEKLLRVGRRKIVITSLERMAGSVNASPPRLGADQVGFGPLPARAEH